MKHPNRIYDPKCWTELLPPTTTHDQTIHNIVPTVVAAVVAAILKCHSNIRGPCCYGVVDNAFTARTLRIINSQRWANYYWCNILQDFMESMPIPIQQQQQQHLCHHHQQLLLRVVGGRKNMNVVVSTCTIIDSHARLRWWPRSLDIMGIYPREIISF